MIKNNFSIIFEIFLDIDECGSNPCMNDATWNNKKIQKSYKNTTSTPTPKKMVKIILLKNFQTLMNVDRTRA